MATSLPVPIERPLLAQHTSLDRQSGRAFRIVRIVLGILLLTAAGLKLYGLNVTALPRAGWFATPGVQLIAAEWELVLGLWLLSGAFQFGAWLAAIGTFATFAAVSAYFGWIGIASCGCFGVIRTSPWVVFSVDVAALVVLAFVRPEFRIAGRPAARRAAIVPIAALGLLVAVTGLGSLVYGSPDAAFARLRGETLTISPSYLDFGSHVAGESLEGAVQVHNWTDHEVRIIGGTSDCSCIATADLPVILPPGGTTTLSIRVIIPDVKRGAVTRTAELWTDSRPRILRLQVGYRVSE